MSIDVEGLLRRLPSAYARGALSNNRKVAEAFHEAFWHHADADIAEFRTQLIVKTCTEPVVLDNLQKGWLDIDRRIDEPFNAWKFRIMTEMAARVASTAPDEILSVVEGILGANPGDVKLTQNKDGAGTYRRAYFRITFSVDLLEALGIPVSQFVTLVGEVDALVKRLAPTGVLGEAATEGGAAFDSGVWDTGLWG